MICGPVVPTDDKFRCTTGWIHYFDQNVLEFPVWIDIYIGNWIEFWWRPGSHIANWAILGTRATSCRNFLLAEHFSQSQSESLVHVRSSRAANWKQWMMAHWFARSSCLLLTSIFVYAVASEQESSVKGGHPCFCVLEIRATGYSALKSLRT